MRHIPVDTKDIGQAVLLPGDPARAEYIARKYLTNTKELGRSREFFAFKGSYENIPMVVVSTGIGCPSTAIAVQELISLGANNLIRVGTAGGALRKDIAAGSLVIPTAAIREEGTTAEYVDPRYPAVADYELVASLKAAAEERGFSAYVGINRTHDAFYGDTSSLKKWAKSYKRIESKSPSLLSSEMECSALFVISSLFGVRAGAVLAINSSPEDIYGDGLHETPALFAQDAESKSSVDRAILTALDGIKKILAQ